VSEAIEGLKPELVWKYFAEVSRIPRGSGNEAQIAEYVLNQAKAKGLEAFQDATGNVLVRVPATTPEMEGAPMVCLQGHLDMVCEANADKEHDFTTDPITLVREGNVVTADGTTLGADNGVAIAAGLALMEDRSIPHGPLELLFTVEEETGLTGAGGLEPGFVQSRTLLNLDSEEEGAVYVGCAGGMDTLGTWELKYKDRPKKSTPVVLSVKGLKGGHSGLDIDKGRGNALKIINRAIMGLAELGARLAMLEGGNKRNAIPREATAVLYVPLKHLDTAREYVEKFAATVQAEYATVEPDLTVTLEQTEVTGYGRVLKKSFQKAICRTIAVLPHGVVKMSPDIPGLVETSTNLASIQMDAHTAVIATSQRSSVASELEEITGAVVAGFKLAGAKVTRGDGYPGWKPNMDSPILAVAVETHKELFGKPPEIKAIHAGLECGIIGEKYPGIDMISFGPTLEAVHSPDERIYVDTVERFWSFLLAMLKNVGKPTEA